MNGLSATDAALLVTGGLASGVLNTLAGGGSLLSVPLLVLIGLPGTLANGTNRLGVLLQNAAAVWRFRAAGQLPLASIAPVIVPVGVGSLLGAWVAARIDDATFERIFGVVMLVLLVPTLRVLSRRTRASAAPRRWPPAVAALVFAGIGVYAGALQAGVGLPLLVALIHAGHDAVRANAIKGTVIAIATAAALPVFALHGQIAWLPGAILAAGFAAGGALGARIALVGGERAVRPVLIVAVIALAARMLGLY
jgi:uncharacterized membrane protein YfcA